MRAPVRADARGMMFVSQGGAVKTPMVSDVDWRACRHGSDEVAWKNQPAPSF